MKNQKAFTIIEAILIVAIVAVVGLIGYLFVSRSMSKQASVSTLPATVTSINSTSDIDTVSTELDKLNLDSDSNSDLDSLNNSLNSF